MNKRAEKVFFYLHQPVFIIYCQIGLEFYTERSADRVEEQVSIFHVLDDGVSSVGISSRQNAASFIRLAPSVMATSLSSSSPKPINVGVEPEPKPILMEGASGPPS